jgi:hypothetical protein
MSWLGPENSNNFTLPITEVAELSGSVLVIVFVRMVAGMRVIGRPAEDHALEVPEVPPRERQQPTPQQHVHQIHVRRVVGTKTQKMFDQLNQVTSIVGNRPHKANS